MRKLLLLTISLIVFSSFFMGEVKAGIDDNVSGYAWSENIGWISLNSTNCDSNNDGITDNGNYPQCPVGQTVVSYGVNINSDGTFSGYAWSENIGWIDFAPAGPYPTAPDYPVKVTGNQLFGWARALAPVGDPEAGGWSGWIKLRGTNYGVSINNNDFSDWAWSDMVIGWISFNSANCDSDGDGISDQGNYGQCPVGQPVPDYGTVTSYSFNQPPDKPTIPLGYQPTGIVYLGECTYPIPVPSFNWEYNDSDDDPLGTDPQTSYQIRVDNDAVFATNTDGSAILDADEFVCSSVPVRTICSGGSSVSFAPQSAEWIAWAEHNTPYHWVARVKDSNDNWSEWSDIVSFSTPQHTYPGPSFVHTPEFPAADEIVTFIDQSTCYNINNNPYGCQYSLNNRYQWDFEDDDDIDCDSNISSDCRGNATTSYSGTGSHTVRLYLTDDLGICDGTGDTPISIQAPLPEYKEVPPTIFWDRFLAEILLPFKNLLININD